MSALVSLRECTRVDPLDGHITDLNGPVRSFVGDDVTDLVGASKHDRVLHQSRGYCHADPQSFLLGVADGETFFTIGITLAHHLRVIAWKEVE